MFRPIFSPYAVKNSKQLFPKKQFVSILSFYPTLCKTSERSVHWRWIIPEKPYFGPTPGLLWPKNHKARLFPEKSFRSILKLVSAIFIKFLFFHQMIALQTLWKMFFISSKKLFSFSRYSIFCISVLPSFSACRPLL